MRDGHPKRLTRSPRARWLVAAALISGVLVAGCGGGSNNPSVASVSSTTTSTTSSAASTGAAVTSRSSTATTSPSSTVAAGSATSSGSTARGVAAELAFAKCMRANGVPNFPDPDASGNFQLPRGSAIGPLSPLFHAAQAKCHELLPNGGALNPGLLTHPSAQAIAKMLKVSQCMRKHGISWFPDPTTSIPTNLAGIDFVADINGAILVVYRRDVTTGPAYGQAAVTCGLGGH